MHSGVGQVCLHLLQNPVINVDLACGREAEVGVIYLPSSCLELGIEQKRRGGQEGIEWERKEEVEEECES